MDQWILLSEGLMLVSDRHRCPWWFPACLHSSLPQVSLFFYIMGSAEQQQPQVHHQTLDSTLMQTTVSQRQQLSIDFIHQELLPPGPTSATGHAWFLRYKASNCPSAPMLQRERCVTYFSDTSTLLLHLHCIISFHNCVRSNSFNQSLTQTLTGTLPPWLIPDR